MQRISKSSRLFLDILFAVYATCEYCSEYLGFSLDDDITSIYTKIREKDGISIIRFDVPAVEDFEYEHPTMFYRDYMQEILNIVQDAETALVPYIPDKQAVVGNIHPLYIDCIARYRHGFFIDIIYIDNPIAYNYVKSQQTNIKI